MLKKILKLLGSALSISVVVSGCSSNDHENASIEEECIYLSKISNRELSELIALELIKIQEDEQHFHRRTGEPEDYEPIDLDSENAPSE